MQTTLAVESISHPSPQTYTADLTSPCQQTIPNGQDKDRLNLNATGKATRTAIKAGDR
eukprot:c13979_g1_i1 orf=251-424(+)